MNFGIKEGDGTTSFEFCGRLDLVTGREPVREGLSSSKEVLSPRMGSFTRLPQSLSYAGVFPETFHDP